MLNNLRDLAYIEENFRLSSDFDIYIYEKILKHQETQLDNKRIIQFYRKI